MSLDCVVEIFSNIFRAVDRKTKWINARDRMVLYAHLTGERDKLPGRLQPPLVERNQWPMRLGNPVSADSAFHCLEDRGMGDHTIFQVCRLFGKGRNRIRLRRLLGDREI